MPAPRTNSAPSPSTLRNVYGGRISSARDAFDEVLLGQPLQRVGDTPGAEAVWVIEIECLGPGPSGHVLDLVWGPYPDQDHRQIQLEPDLSATPSAENPRQGRHITVGLAAYEPRRQLRLRDARAGVQALLMDEHAGSLRPPPLLGLALALVEGLAEFLRLQRGHLGLLLVDLALVVELLALDVELPGLDLEQLALLLDEHLLVLCPLLERPDLLALLKRTRRWRRQR